jgi:hypothetical protein
MLVELAALGDVEVGLKELGGFQGRVQFLDRPTVHGSLGTGGRA